MASSQASGDEFDNLPNPFEGIDFDQIAELSTVAVAGAVDKPAAAEGSDSEVDYDSFFDEIDPRALDGVPHLGPVDPPALPPPTQPPAPAPAPAPADPSEQGAVADASAAAPDRNLPARSQALSMISTQYSFDDIDDAYLEQVRDIERQAMAPTLADNAPVNLQRSVPSSKSAGSTQVRRIECSISFASSVASLKDGELKRKRSDVSCTPQTPTKRAKFSRVPSKSYKEFALKMLLKLEPDITCSICRDVIVAAQCTNPCGHSFCAHCFMEHMKGPMTGDCLQCPLCRGKLDVRRPIISNFAIDNTVRDYVAGMAEVGDKAWKPSGENYKFYEVRKEASVQALQEIAQYQKRNLTPRELELLISDRDSSDTGDDIYDSDSSTYGD
ncbi:hypothetical protein BD413DRAFT_562845 [Trametes elegans]|nr:hypothetical protein BD413DRAFT_562845 [Trametes elegans]